MSMKPSRKIFIGASAILTGISLQIVAGLVAMRSTEILTESIKTGNSMVVDRQLEQSHWLMTAIFYGTSLSYLLLIVGLLFICIGAYQNAKRTEQLLESLRTQAPPQVP